MMKKIALLPAAGFSEGKPARERHERRPDQVVLNPGSAVPARISEN